MANLHTGDHSIPLRSSLDDETDLAEDSGLLEESQEETSTRHRQLAIKAPSTSRDETIGRGGPRKYVGMYQRVTQFCWKRRVCLLAIVVVVGAILGAGIAGGFWIYRSVPTDGESPPWYPTPRGGSTKTWEESYKKAAAMVSRMSLVEKVNVTTGTGWSQDLCVGNTAPAANAGFPSLCLQDGPLGIRFTDHATAFPAGITTGATWNRTLMYLRGKAHGKEARLKGINVLLGPAMGPLGRQPAGGRNWEGFGSDPVLQGIGAAETIRGIQEEGVIATAKHFILNEQEHYRQAFEWGLPHALSANCDDRTLHELYLWPFAESVRAGVGSVMCSYNMINNSYACGNSKLMNGILKDELGFQGFVQSDWLAQRSGVASALAGLDVSMPGDGLYWMNGDSLWGPQLTTAVLNGSVPVERINDMTTRIVAAWYQMGQDDQTIWPVDKIPNFSSWTNEKEGPLHPASDDTTTTTVNHFVDVQGKGEDSHGKLARQIAAEGVVLVKNEGVLPLNRRGRSGQGNATIEARFKVGVFGVDAGPGDGPNACADRGCNQGTLASGWGSGAVDFPYLVTPLEGLRDAFDPRFVQVSDYLTNNLDTKANASIVEAHDLCLVFVNSDGGEGYIASEGIRGDRNDLFLQHGGDALVKTVANGCGRGNGETIVVVHAIGPVILEKWIDMPGVKAVVLANLPGQESGNALADVIFGDVDASGRLPYTVAKSLDDYGASAQILCYPNGALPQQDFKDGLYIDYRHFDFYNIAPRFEFGFGLSYTTFSVSNLTITTIKPKSPLPAPRPDAPKPPSYDSAISDPSTALFPSAFRQLKNRIYPYISSPTIAKGDYPYPTGFTTIQQPSPAGGAEGGNPSLFDIHTAITIDLRNTGSRSGQQVVQLYVSFPSGVTEPGSGAPITFPLKVLRAFDKVLLDVGATTNVRLELTRKDLSFWSVERQNWIMPEGSFTIHVGFSSRDLPLEGTW